MIDGEEPIDFRNDSKLYKKLKERGYIFETKDEETQIINTLREINNKSRLDKLNTQFVICPTMGCNLRCTYCFEGNEQHTNYTLLSDKQLEVIFNHIQKCYGKFKEKLNLDANEEIKKSTVEFLCSTNFVVWWRAFIKN